MIYYQHGGKQDSESVPKARLLPSHFLSTRRLGRSLALPKNHRSEQTLKQGKPKNNAEPRPVEQAGLGDYAAIHRESNASPPPLNAIGRTTQSRRKRTKPHKQGRARF
jgi:hypothetical protein